MGKRGIQRPHVVSTRLNDAEKAKLQALRGPLSESTFLRILLERAESPDPRDP